MPHRTLLSSGYVGQKQGGMATRNRQNWKLDNQGEYPRQIGWKYSRNGKLIQHKCRLGADLKEVKRREHKLLELWGQIEATTATPGLPISRCSFEIGPKDSKSVVTPKGKRLLSAKGEAIGLPDSLHQ